MTPQTPPTEDLIARLEAGKKGNSLDVLIECALFEPDDEFEACRPNNAGTKVIYFMANGSQSTCWARDWTMPSDRAATLAALRARSPLMGSAQG